MIPAGEAFSEDNVRIVIRRWDCHKGLMSTPESIPRLDNRSSRTACLFRHSTRSRVGHVSSRVSVERYGRARAPRSVDQALCDKEVFVRESSLIGEFRRAVSVKETECAPKKRGECRCRTSRAVGQRSAQPLMPDSIPLWLVPWQTNCLHPKACTFPRRFSSAGES
jgi:hypothetical protein